MYYWYDICLGFQSDSKKSGFYIATHTVSCQNESRLFKSTLSVMLMQIIQTAHKGWFNRICSRREIQNIHNVRKLLDQDKNLLLQGFFCLTFLLMMLCFWWRDFSNRLQTKLSFLLPCFLWKSLIITSNRLSSSPTHFLLQKWHYRIYNEVDDSGFFVYFWFHLTAHLIFSRAGARHGQAIMFAFFHQFGRLCGLHFGHDDGFLTGKSKFLIFILTFWRNDE